MTAHLNFTFQEDSKHFLIAALDSDAFEKLKPLEITHIHGRMPPLLGEKQASNWRERTPLSYGDYRQRTPIVRVLNSDDDGPSQSEIYKNQLLHSVWSYGQSTFKTVYQNNEVNETAKKILESSSRVFFLGFGYHELNMKILGLNFNEKTPGKIVVGTGLNLPPVERKQVLTKYPALLEIHDCSCIQLFQNHYPLLQS